MSESQRNAIRNDVAAHIEAVYGPSGKAWFREVASGPWRPGAHARPRLTVGDGGQRTADYGDDERNKSFGLALELTLDLKANWREEYGEWVDRVQELIADLYNSLFAWGMIRMDYVEDSPFEVVLSGGSSEQVWLIDFEATYEQDVGIVE